MKKLIVAVMLTLSGVVAAAPAFYVGRDIVFNPYIGVYVTRCHYNYFGARYFYYVGLTDFCPSYIEV